LFVRNRSGYAVQVVNGEREEFAKRSGVFHDAKHGAYRAVAAQASLAPFAVPAGEVNFAGYAASDPFRAGSRNRHHFANEFMSWGPGESIVAALQFEIGGTDTGGQ
jgi:hypothetical protein